MGVKVSTDYRHNEQFGDCWCLLVGWEKCTEYFIKMQQAYLEGLDYFIMPEDDYREALEYIGRNGGKEGER